MSFSTAGLCTHAMLGNMASLQTSTGKPQKRNMDVERERERGKAFFVCCRRRRENRAPWTKRERSNMPRSLLAGVCRVQMVFTAQKVWIQQRWRAELSDCTVADLRFFWSMQAEDTKRLLWTCEATSSCCWRERASEETRRPEQRWGRLQFLRFRSPHSHCESIDRSDSGVMRVAVGRGSSGA